nr:MAG TPA_asm: hypothetical protein [Caudoviricetes sp.]
MSLSFRSSIRATNVLAQLPAICLCEKHLTNRYITESRCTKWMMY